MSEVAGTIEKGVKEAMAFLGSQLFSSNLPQEGVQPKKKKNQ